MLMWLLSRLVQTPILQRTPSLHPRSTHSLRTDCAENHQPSPPLGLHLLHVQQRVRCTSATQQSVCRGQDTKADDTACWRHVVCCLIGGTKVVIEVVDVTHLTRDTTVDTWTSYYLWPGIKCFPYVLFGRFEKNPPTLFFFIKWRSARTHQCHCLGQKQSTVAQRAETPVDERSLTSWARTPFPDSFPHHGLTA